MRVGGFHFSSRLNMLVYWRHYIHFCFEFIFFMNVNLVSSSELWYIKKHLLKSWSSFQMWGIWLICLLLRYGRILVIKYGKILEINVQWLTLKGTCTKGKSERKYFMRERERCNLTVTYTSGFQVRRLAKSG